MDLTYTNAAGVDQGILEAYELDMAYGSDENNFTIEIDSADHCCEVGSKIYAEGEEYGGVVDSIAIDTDVEKIAYSGRTWHGILESKVICPEDGQDYLIVDGEANEVLAEIIEAIGADDLFEASTDDSGIEIEGYQFPRYVYGYTGIRDMLKASGGKLHIEWAGSMVQLSALTMMDYSQDEEFDASQTTFAIEQHYRPTNHVICLGQGNLADRAVIHIFTDENGGIQDYATTDTPIQDSDYILDTSNQVMTGVDEVMEILDYPSAEIVTNYDLLTARPSDWRTKPTKYFYRSSDGSYKSVEWDLLEYGLQRIEPYDWDVNFSKYYSRSGDTYSAVTGSTVYEVLTVKPSDWAKRYSNYYTASGSGYAAVTGVTSEAYVAQTSRPKDWSKNYGSYYYFYSDGVTTEYKSVEGITYYVYKLQTRRPTDWTTQYTSYYRKATAKELKTRTQKYYSVTANTKKTTNAQGRTVTQRVPPTWKPRKYYTQISKQRAPAWNALTRFTYVKTKSAPTWTSRTYYEKLENSAPVWAEKTYYTKIDEQIAPTWEANTYYRAVTDRYATMIESAKEHLAEAHESSPMEISLEESDTVYDVGDIVGVLEPTTGISATQEIVKKVIKISNDDIKVTYEVK